jgi:hypothetical protein
MESGKVAWFSASVEAPRETGGIPADFFGISSAVKRHPHPALPHSPIKPADPMPLFKKSSEQAKK